VHACPRESVAVIEFQATSLGAPPAVLVDERAASTVAGEDRTLDRIGDVARRPVGLVAVPERVAGSAMKFVSLPHAGSRKRTVHASRKSV
jgi:hypothetical protein